MKDQFDYEMRRKAIEMMLYQEGVLIRQNYWKRRREGVDNDAARDERDAATNRALEWKFYLERIAGGYTLGAPNRTCPEGPCMPLTLALWRKMIKDALNDDDPLVERMVDFFAAQMAVMMTGMSGSATEERNALIDEMRSRLKPATKDGGAFGKPPQKMLRPDPPRNKGN